MSNMPYIGSLAPRMSHRVYIEDPKNLSSACVRSLRDRQNTNLSFYLPVFTYICFFESKLCMNRDMKRTSYRRCLSAASAAALRRASAAMRSLSARSAAALRRASAAMRSLSARSAAALRRASAAMRSLLARSAASLRFLSAIAWTSLSSL